MMKRLLTWARDLVMPDRYEAEDHINPAVPRVRPRPLPRQNQDKPRQPTAIRYAAETGGRIVDGGPGKNILVKNKYIREDTGTHETLKILDESLLEDSREGGADPYNTGRFDRSKSWDSSRFRK